MSMMDKISGFITALLIFVGLPALLLYAAYRQLSENKVLSGVVLLLLGAGLAWASFQFMYCVGPHPNRYC
jgi:predicted permease